MFSFKKEKKLKNDNDKNVFFLKKNLFNFDWKESKNKTISKTLIHF